MLILQISRSRNPRDANVVSEYSDAKEKRANRLYWQSEKVTGGGVEQQQANSNSDGQMEGGRTRRRRGRQSSKKQNHGDAAAADDDGQGGGSNWLCGDSQVDTQQRKQFNRIPTSEQRPARE